MTARLILGLIAFFVGTATATAQEPSPELRARAEQVVSMVRGGETPTEMFAAEFLAQVPEPQLRATSQELITLYGPIQRIARIEAGSATAGVLHVDFERAVLQMRIRLEDAPPHRIRGLLVTGAEQRE